MDIKQQHNTDNNTYNIDIQCNQITVCPKTYTKGIVNETCVQNTININF